MDVAQLVAELLPLLTAPAQHHGAILSLLGKHRTLVDYEVARFLVSRRTEAFVQELLTDPDPYQRRRAIDWVELTFARSPAARVLRDATKDRSQVVRRAASRATRALGLDEVALPDPRRGVPAVPERSGINPFTREPIVIPGRPGKPARYDVTGWRFGLYRGSTKPSRPVAALAQLRSKEDVLRLLGVTETELTPLLRPGAGPGCPYITFEIPKSTGGSRQLCAPRRPLKALQRKLLRQLFAPLPVHAAAHGFVPLRSTLTNARPHVGAQVILKMDLVEFFPTIHFGRIIGLCHHYGMGREAARTIAAIVTYRPKLADGRVAWPSILPQGAPTSPALSNLVCRRLDARLSALAAKAGATYTRYADDLTFSFNSDPGKGLGHFAWWVNQVIGQEGFVENLKKRRILRPSSRMCITGLVVNSSLTIPRTERRRFRALLHRCRQLGVSPETTGHPEPAEYLRGYVAYVAMVQPKLASVWKSEIFSLVG